LQRAEEAGTKPRLSLQHTHESRWVRRFRRATAYLYAWGVLLTPALGAVLTSASAVIVAVNARMLKLKEDRAEAGGEPHAQI